MAFYSEDLVEDTLRNKSYRRVIYTVPDSFQLVLMSLPPEEEIGEEVHPDTTQFILTTSGIGLAEIDELTYVLEKNSTVVIPPGAKHNIINFSTSERLSLFTIYTPPEHPPK